MKVLGTFILAGVASNLALAAPAPVADSTGNSLGTLLGGAKAATDGAGATIEGAKTVADAASGDVGLLKRDTDLRIPFFRGGLGRGGILGSLGRLGNTVGGVGAGGLLGGLTAKLPGTLTKGTTDVKQRNNGLTLRQMPEEDEDPCEEYASGSEERKECLADFAAEVGGGMLK